MSSATTPIADVSQLLMKEQEELNNWVRITLQIYFAWYCVFLTVNGTGLAALSPAKPGLKFAYFLFALWNALGIIVGFYVASYVRKSNARINNIYQSLIPLQEQAIRPQSPLPSKTALGAIILDTIAMLSLLIAWTCLLLSKVPATPPPNPSNTPPSASAHRWPS
jgi:hypothetical protein